MRRTLTVDVDPDIFRDGMTVVIGSCGHWWQVPHGDRPGWRDCPYPDPTHGRVNVMYMDVWTDRDSLTGDVTDYAGAHRLPVAV